MTIYGYARTSTIDQVAGLADQVTKLKGAGCSNQTIYQEQISSVRMEDRIEFTKALAALAKAKCWCSAVYPVRRGQWCT